MISIHALQAESDLPFFNLVTVGGDFNPRPPSGERPHILCRRRLHQHFNPRPPSGERLVQYSIRLFSILFQSTPSKRRATQIRAQAHPRLSISIHALQAESDVQVPIRLCSQNNFNPRPPSGERLLTFLQVCCYQRFQSTPSKRRATRRDCRALHPYCHFNPRPPSGERPLSKSTTTLSSIRFQSTPSKRRATRACNCDTIVDEFQSTPSKRRATYSVFEVYEPKQNFNPRPPSGERHSLSSDI